MSSLTKERPWPQPPPARRPQARQPLGIHRRHRAWIPLCRSPLEAVTIKCSTKVWHPMASGWRRLNTVMSGNPRRTAARIGALTPRAAGQTPIRDGPGSPRNLSAGPPITTAAGRCSVDRAGSGFPVIPGPRRGFRGGIMRTTLAGPPCRQRLFMRTTPNTALALTTIMASAPTVIISCLSVTLMSRFMTIAGRDRKTPDILT